MKIRGQAKELFDACKIAGERTSKSVNKQTSNLLIEVKDNLIFNGTNLDIWIESSCDCEVIEGGVVTTPFSQIYKLLENLDGELELERKGSKLLVTSETGKFELNLNDPELFPTKPKIDEGRVSKIEPIDKRFRLKLPYPSEVKRPPSLFLTGRKVLYLLHDHQFMRLEIEGEGYDLQIPDGIIDSLYNGYEISDSGNFVSSVSDNVRRFCRKGEYPVFKREQFDLILDSELQNEVDVDEFIDAITPIIGVFSGEGEGDGYKSLKAKISKEEIYSESKGRRAKTKFNGGIDCALNLHYLIHALNPLRGQKCDIGVVNGNFILRKDNYTRLVAGMKND